jgi:hypothetical protein
MAAGIVGTVLEGTGFPMTKIDAVRGAIRTPMYYRDPIGPEAVKMLEEYLKSVPQRVLSPAGRARMGPRKSSCKNFSRIYGASRRICERCSG